jgi:hypothetical protein
MLRIPLAALASVVFLMLTPHAAQSQLVPRDPRQPKIILRPDLVATIDQSTRIVFAKKYMRIDGTSTAVLRPIVDLAVCTGLTDGQRRAVAVSPLMWGVQNGLLNGPNPTGLGATQVPVTLSYQTVNNGLVAEQVINETVDVLGVGARRLFAFTHPLRPTGYEVSLFKEPPLTPRQPATNTEGGTGGGTGAKSGTPPAVILRTFCVPNIETVDHLMVITADPAARIDDSNRANNVLRIP